MHRVRRSLALKLILASAIPSALVLIVGELSLLAHAHRLSKIDAALAFVELRTGVLLGTLLALTFAGMTIALAARHFLLKPVEALRRVMARAELGDFLVRARVQSEDELGALAKSFNTMLSRVTDMAIADIETRESLHQAQRELALQEELKQLNDQLEAHVGEMELLLEVSKAVSGTIELHEQLEALGKQVCARFGVSEFSLMLVDEPTRELVCEAIAGRTPLSARGLRFPLGTGIAGEVAATGKHIYVPDIAQEPRYVRLDGETNPQGSLLSVPLRAQGKVLGVMNLNRPRTGAFTPQEVRLAEAVGAQAALSIANARLYQETLELSFTDQLTGLANRRQLFLRLDQELSRANRFGDSLSVLMLDLDLFKQVNDKYGHTVGDEVLRVVAATLKRNVRKIDLVARYGGEEFCVLLPRVGKPEAIEVAEKLRRAIDAADIAQPEPQKPLHVTISVGVSSLGVDAADGPALIERADSALYEAKRLGRDRVSAGAPVLATA